MADAKLPEPHQVAGAVHRVQGWPEVKNILALALKLVHVPWGHSIRVPHRQVAKLK